VQTDGPGGQKQFEKFIDMDSPLIRPIQIRVKLREYFLKNKNIKNIF
jgi:hypothetical protein